MRSTKRGISKLLTALALVLIITPAIVLTGTVPADAAGTKVEIPVKVTFDGSNLPSETFVVECAGGESGELMTRETALSAVRKTETISFEETLPVGIYEYTVKEAAGTDSDISYSDRIYTVNVMVNNDGTVEMSVADQDAQDKPDQILFENKYDAPDNPIVDPVEPVEPVDPVSTPKNIRTGDNTLVWPLAAALLAAVIALVAIIVKRRKDDR